MAVAAQHNNSPLAIQDTIGNRAFIDSLDRAVTAATYQAFAEGQPTYLPGCAGQFMYYYAVHNTFQALSDQGFIVEYKLNQLRLHARDRYDYSIHLRFGIGTNLGKTFIFNWPKGIATAEGVEQNQSLLQVRTQMPLFGDWDDQKLIEPALNLWIMYNVRKDYLRASLGLGIQRLSVRKIYCSQIVEICSKPLDTGVGADFFVAPSIESDYPFDFGEKSGTE